MKLIVGLGNPGSEYEKTRHNSGFLAMDELASLCHAELRQEKWNALVTTVHVEGTAVMLMKPLTYMNESGQAVAQAWSFYDLQPEDLLVIHDDMDLPVGSVRIRARGSSGGQRGMQSIISHIGTSDFMRIRIGVGHSTAGIHEEVPGWVLSPVPAAEQEPYQGALKQAARAAYAWIYEPAAKVMEYNVRERAPKGGLDGQ